MQGMFNCPPTCVMPLNLAIKNKANSLHSLKPNNNVNIIKDTEEAMKKQFERLNTASVQIKKLAYRAINGMIKIQHGD